MSKLFSLERLSTILERVETHVLESNPILAALGSMDEEEPTGHVPTGKDTVLTISGDNNKIKHPSLSLPAGWSCPGAKECRSCASQKDDGSWGIIDGPDTLFRCFAASQEVGPSGAGVRKSRWKNFNLIKAAKTTSNILNLLERSFQSPFNKYPKPPVFRIHVSGDFFSQDYFDAWMEYARAHPETIFYAYTKSLPFWLARRDVLPQNFVLNASAGGKWDNLIRKHNLKYARVVFSEEEAEDLGLPIDHDDRFAWSQTQSFALLIHGTQPAGTPAAKAWQSIKTDKELGGYSAGKEKQTMGVLFPTADANLILSGAKVINVYEDDRLNAYVKTRIGIIQKDPGSSEAILVAFASVRDPRVYHNQEEFEADTPYHRQSWTYSGKKTLYGYPLANVIPVEPVIITTRGAFSRRVPSERSVPQLTSEQFYRQMMNSILFG